MNCVQTLSTSVACFAKGTHTVEFRPGCDTKGINPYGVETCENVSGPAQTASFNVDDPKPTVTLIVTGPDANGLYTASATYNFPSTETAGQRLVTIKFNGATVVGENPASPSGNTGSGTFSGCGVLVATAESCGLSDADHHTEQKQLINPQGCAYTRFCPTCQQYVGIPVNVGSGDVTLTIPLFSIAEPTTSLNFGLTYHSSKLIFPGLLNTPGAWSHGFDQRLIGDSYANYLYLIDEMGQESVYQRVGTSNSWFALRPRALHNTVTLVGNEYRLQDPQGTVRGFDTSTGYLLRASDRWGNTTSLQYDASWNLTGITDALGRQLNVTASGTTINSIVLPGGATWRFIYSSGYLSAIFDPLHTGTTPWRSFTYATDPSGDPRLLITMTDDAGAVLEGHQYGVGGGGTSYRGNNRDQVTIDYRDATTRYVTEQIDATTSQTSTFTVDVQGGVYTTTHLAGGCQTCGSSSDDLAFQYSADQQVSQVTDARGAVTQYDHDVNGNVLTVRQAAGTPRERVVTHEYADATWAAFVTKTTRTAPNAGTVVEQATWTNNESTLTQTVTGRLVGGGANTTYTTTQSFDSRHRLTSADGPRTDAADVVSYAYYADNDANLSRRGRVSTVTDPAGNTTTLDDYDIYGTARRITDPNGVITTIVTDARGRVTSTTSNAVAGDASESTAYTTNTVYDTRDRLIQQADARGNITAYVYENGTNRLTDTIRNSSGNQVERRHLTLNTIGQVTREELQSCTTPAPACTSWSSRRTEDSTYDAHARLASVRHADNTVITCTYDANGNLASVSDERHITPNITYAYDELNRVTRVTQILAGAPGGMAVTAYSYDTLDNLSSVTDPNSNITAYAIDDFGRLQQQNSPVTGLTTYSYDAAANLTSSTDANGSTTTRQYDAANRITSATSTRAGASETVSWAYDSTASGAYGRGRLTSMTDPTGTTAYSYDRRGLLKREVKTIEGNPYTTSYAYDPAGNRTTMNYPSGMTVAYGFDSANRATSATMGSTPLVTSATYLPIGPKTQMVYGNGTTATLSYDARYRITTNHLGGTGTLADYTYTYDNGGNITAITDTQTPAYNRTFAYDDLNRLTTANSGTNLWGNGSYTYDAMGNVLTSNLGSVRNRTFAYSGTTPKLQSVTQEGTTSTLTYDAAGNEATVGAEQYAYSPRNNLATAPSVAYEYDGRGIRTITRITTDLTIVSLTVAPATVIGGSAATATITISGPAPAGGALVALTSDNTPVARLPQSLVIAAGATSGTASVTTYSTPTTTNVTLRGALGGITASGTLTIQTNNTELASIAVSPNAVVGGHQTPTGMVTLTQPAPPGGATVVLTSSDSTVASVPVSVVVSSGSTTATFAITTQTVGATNNVTITGTYGATQSATLTVTTCAGWSPAAALLGNETVWFDDAIPTGASQGGWSWDTTQHASGTQSMRSDDIQWPGFWYANPRLHFDNGCDQLIVYVLLDPCAPPPEIMIDLWTQDWGHRWAFWGADLRNSGTLGSDRFNIGPLPPVGQWVRLAMPLAAVHLTTADLFGMEFEAIGTGVRAWFDRVGKVSGSTSSAPPPSSFPPGDVVWFDDAPPTGATVYGTWNWDVTQKASGTSSHNDPGAYGFHQHYYTTPTATVVGSTDKLVTYVLLDPCDPPSEIMVGWNDGSGWEHRAYWGQNLIAAGTDGTQSRLPMGSLPIAGQWVRLEVPSANVGITNVYGMQFCVNDGHAWFDRPGNAPAGSGALAPLLGGNVQVANALSSVATRIAGATVAVWQRAKGWLIRRWRPEPPVSLAVTAQLVRATATAGSLRRYSLYTPELNLMSETNLTSATAPPIAFEYIWFDGQPLAQTETATGAVHYYFNDHLGTPILTTTSVGAADWRVEREPYGLPIAFRAGAALHQSLSFPGQEMDEQLTDRSYNIFRPYRSGWGRYTQPDPATSRSIFAVPTDNPIAITHSVHPYLYTDGRPSVLIDPLGLQPAIPIPVPSIGSGTAAAAAAAAAAAICWAIPSCRQQMKCGLMFARDIARCTVQGLCNAFGTDPLHDARVESCIFRSLANQRACRAGWPRPFPDPWPGPDFRGPRVPTIGPEPQTPTEAEPPARAAGF